MTRRSDLLATAERVVESAMVRKDVEGAEAFAVLDHEIGATIEKNAADLAQTHESYGIAVRVLVKGRLGFSYVTEEDEAGAAVDAAIQASRLSKKIPFAFPEPGKAKRVAGLWDSKLDAVEADAVVDAAGAVIDVVAESGDRMNATGGGVSSGTTHWAVANSAGVAVSHRQTGLTAACYVVREAEHVSTGWAHDSSTRQDVDVQEIGREAARLAASTQAPAKLSGAKVRDVVIRPHAAAELLATITLSSLSGRAVHRQESYYAGKKGDQVAAKSFGLVEDATVNGGLGSGPTDEEGVPSRPVALIEDGVLRRFLYDQATAAEYDGQTTASAVRAGGLDGRSFKAPPIVSARQIRVEAPQTSFDDLVASVDDGVLVHDLMGVHTANTVSGDFGVTSSLLFRIEDGAVGDALAPVSISGNLHESLEKGIQLGDDARRVDAGVGFVLPSVRFRGLTVTP